jgi:tetratricopeptide (TPR) repeat protein
MTIKDHLFLKRAAQRSAVLVLLFFLIGCARMHAYDAFHNYQYDKAISDFKEASAKQEKYLAKKNKYGRNYALPYLHLASAAFTAGSYSLADESLAQVRPLMHRIKEDSSKNVAAIMITEDKRQYKGDPYEVTMANFYHGIVRYYSGDYDRALALFRRALVSDMDANTNDENELNDFTIAHLMAAKTYQILGETDNAQVMLGKAEPYIQDRAHFEEFKDGFLTDNFTLLIENGVGPYKESVGMGRAAIRLVSGHAPVHSIQVLINGELYGPALKTIDVFEQAAQHTPSGGRRAIQAVKGLIAGTTKLVIGMQFTGSKSDARSWILLPHDMFLFSAQLDPGLYTVTLKCFDKKGREMPRYEQSWYYIPVQEEKSDTFLVLSTGLDKCNQYKKIKRQYALSDTQLQEVKSWK